MHLIYGRAKLAVPLFPKDAQIVSFYDTSPTEFPPTISVHEADTIQIDLDRQKMSSLGISIADATGAMNAMSLKNATPELLNRVKQLGVNAADGKSHRLGDFAEIKIVREPNHFIRRWP